MSNNQMFIESESAVKNQSDPLGFARSDDWQTTYTAESNAQDQRNI